MIRDLDYFIEFLDNPATYDDEEYRRMFDEWVEFVVANKGKLDTLGDDWAERRERLRNELERRDPITPQMREEFANIKFLLELPNQSKEFRIQIAEMMLEFMKKYQTPFKFSDERIAKQENNIKRYYEKLEKVRISAEALRISKEEVEKAKKLFEEAMFAEYERTGKPPVISTLISKKKHDGN